MRYVRPYAIKHSYATECAERGADLLELRDALGHTDLKSTDGYIRRTLARRERLTRPGTLTRLARTPHATDPTVPAQGTPEKPGS